jgi:hypothetical protein
VTMNLKGTETKLFDPNDASTASNGAELLDSSVVKRGDQWHMFLAGQAHGFGAPQFYGASLAPHTPLSATGWNLARDPSGELIPLAPPSTSGAWDADGGRHCPSYVKGYDPHANRWVERLYYAGGAEFIWGPYTIGYLEWDGTSWLPQSEPVFCATEDWEHGSVYEPNLIYHDGKWKMWYVAGSNHEKYLVHGYSESLDGRTWGPHTLFASAEMFLFDFCVRPRGNAFDAIFSRVSLGDSMPPPETGLWYCRADAPHGDLKQWSQPVQIMTAEDRGWHTGPWKPSLAFDEQDLQHAFIFFDGLYNTGGGGPFPFAFTLGCLEIDFPDKSVR